MDRRYRITKFEYMILLYISSSKNSSSDSTYKGGIGNMSSGPLPRSFVWYDIVSFLEVKLRKLVQGGVISHVTNGNNRHCCYTKYVREYI